MGGGEAPPRPSCALYRFVLLLSVCTSLEEVEVNYDFRYEAVLREPEVFFVNNLFTWRVCERLWVQDF